MDASLLGLVLTPAVFLWLRFPREPRGCTVLRYVCAFFVAWWAFGHWVMQVHEQGMAAAEARGDYDSLDADTGAGAMVLLIGWVPASVYTALLGILRRGWINATKAAENH